nr:TPA_inf: variable region-containing chitin-binding protein 5 [Branchiostoma floridae]
MLGLLVAISAVACFESSYADAVSITTVTVPYHNYYVLAADRPWDPTWVNRVEIRCEYTISPAPATPPTITWLRGTFADREVVYKWSSSGEVYVHPEFAGRVSVESRTRPTLVLFNERTWVDRYWCRVTNEEQPDEFGTDEESCGFWYVGIGYNLPKLLATVHLDKTPVHVDAGGTVQLNCTGVPDGRMATIFWVKGPSCTQGGSCDSYETVIHKSSGWGETETITVSPNFAGRVSLATRGVSITPTLTITDIRPRDAGRYWCSINYPDDRYSSSFGRWNRGAQSVVILVNDPVTEPTCADKADGKYQHPADCAQFYTCSGGLSYGTNTCPAGLVFNQDLQLCDWANNVICL